MTLQIHENCTRVNESGELLSSPLRTYPSRNSVGGGIGSSKDEKDVLLVTSPISTTFIEIYPKSIRIKRPFLGEKPEPPLRSDTTIQSFSKKSRSRLRFTAANSGHKIKTQFCMTYGKQSPPEGRELKEHLRKFLNSVKKTFPRFEYIWIAEFQTRGVPHFHFFSNIDHTPANHSTLSRKWHKIAGYGAENHAKVHGHRSNFIEWDMNNGSYLCKYLDKEHQKCIPEGFINFGRWWGNSRNLVPDPTIQELDALTEKYEIEPVTDENGEILTEREPVKLLFRTLGKHHEKINQRSWFRQTSRSTTHITGRIIYDQLLEYWNKCDASGQTRSIREDLLKYRKRITHNLGDYSGSEDRPDQFIDNVPF